MLQKSYNKYFLTVHVAMAFAHSVGNTPHSVFMYNKATVITSIKYWLCLFTAAWLKIEKCSHCRDRLQLLCAAAQVLKPQSCIVLFIGLTVVIEEREPAVLLVDLECGNKRPADRRERPRMGLVGSTEPHLASLCETTVEKLKVDYWM